MARFRALKKLRGICRARAFREGELASARALSTLKGGVSIAPAQADQLWARLNKPGDVWWTSRVPHETVDLIAIARVRQ